MKRLAHIGEFNLPEKMSLSSLFFYMLEVMKPMKQWILKMGVFFSLFIKSQPVQNRLFRLYLEKGDSLQTAIDLIPLAKKFNKQLIYMNMIQRTNQLKDTEKRYIKALIWESLSIFSKALKEIFQLSDQSEEIVKLKGKLLYLERRTKPFLLLLENTEHRHFLPIEMQLSFVKYAYSKEKIEIAKQLCELFLQWGQNKNVEEVYQHIVEIYDIRRKWEDEFQRVSYDIHTAIQTIENLPELEQTQAFIALLQQKDGDEYETVLRWLWEKGVSIPYSEEILLPLKEAIKAKDQKKYQTVFHQCMTAYNRGERSQLLRNMLIESLQNAVLSEQELYSLRNAVESKYIHLLSRELLNALKENNQLISLYEQMMTDSVSLDDFSVFMNWCRTIDHDLAIKMLKTFVRKLFHSNRKLPIAKEHLETINHFIAGDFEFECVKKRWLLEHRQQEELLKEIDGYSSHHKTKMLFYLAKYAYEHEYYAEASLLLNKAFQLRPRSLFVLRTLIGVHHRLGNISERVKYFEELPFFIRRILKNDYEIAKDEKERMKEKWTWKKDLPQIALGDKIVHVLNKSMPEVNGYTIRSREIVVHQKKLGLKPVVVTKLGWPLNRKKTKIENIDGIEYYRLYTQQDIRLNVVPLTMYFEHYAEQFANLLMEIKPRIVHAASNFQNALPAIQAAKKLGIPTVYEVRGFWHDTTASKVKGFEHSERYRMHEEYEIYCCQLADKVVTISESLAQQLISLGVEKNKIFIVPNGVDADVFTPEERDEELMNLYDLHGKIVYGFIGSVTKYEGLDFALKALKRLKQDGEDFHFLLVGDGPVVVELKELVQQLDIAEHVTFVGRVPHDEVKKYYSVIDVFPFPRINAKVCQLVTPLKPYEVMAMGKLVLVSDIPALKEMVIEGETGLIFEAENVESLYECMKKAQADLHIGIKSRKWVERERHWKELCKQYVNIYS